MSLVDFISEKLATVELKGKKHRDSYFAIEETLTSLL
jgi:hypothetical protein